MNPNKDRLTNLMFKVDHFVNGVNDFENNINNNSYTSITEMINTINDLNNRSNEIHDLMRYNNSEYLLNTYYDKWIDFMQIQKMVKNVLKEKGILI